MTARTEHARPAPAARVLEEHDADRGWRFVVELDWGDATTTHELRIAWVDHDHLTGGAAPPSRLAQAVMEAAGASIGRDAVPARSDAAGLRRRIPGFDDDVLARCTGAVG